MAKSQETPASEKKHEIGNSEIPRKNKLYKYSYLSALILDLILIFVAIILIVFGLFVFLQETNDKLLPIIVVPILLFIPSLIQFFGWKGYLCNDAHSAQIFAIYRVVVAVLSFLNILRPLDESNEMYLHRGAFFMLEIALAYGSMKYAEELLNLSPEKK